MSYISSGSAAKLAVSDVVVPRLEPRKTAKIAVYDTLRNLILDGELAPGDRLVESDLSRQLGASKTPLREALLMLEGDGLIVLAPHQGASVTRISIPEYEELQLMRDTLEYAMLDRVATHISEEEIARARMGIEEMRAAMDARDFSRYRRRARDVHQTLFSASGFPTIVRVELDLLDRLARVARFGITQRPGLWIQDFENNRLRVEGIAARDPESVRRQVQAWHDSVLHQLRDSVPDGGDPGDQYFYDERPGAPPD